MLAPIDKLAVSNAEACLDKAYALVREAARYLGQLPTNHLAEDALTTASELHHLSGNLAAALGRGKV